MAKSEVELKKEQAEAQAKVDAMLNSSKKPKNLREGVANGCNNILAGAIGGAGVATLAPIMGFTAGRKNGGIIGGVLGVAGGAVIGVVGAAGMIIGGTVSGVGQIVRGVAAMPEALTAPRKGKWWNEVTHQWVYTDLSKTNVPATDDDLLKPIEEELDDGSQPIHSGAVKDTFYYDILEVDPTAEPSVIKRRYYILARKFHPDKVGKDDKASADKFKEVAEAYQVLSDPQLRAKYDKEGREALSGDKTELNDKKFDPSLLLAFLFGSDRFQDYIGRLATSTSAMIGDSPKLSILDARTLQERRCTRLALKLVLKTSPWVDGEHDMCKTLWKTEAENLSTASYGWELVKTIGMAYEVAALQFLGSTESGIGMPSISKWAAGQKARSKKRKAGRENRFDTLMATMDAMKIQTEYQEKIDHASSEEEKVALQREMEEASQNTLLKLIWSTTVVDITSTIFETCQLVFFDQSVDKEVRKQRAKAVQNLGTIFQDCPEPDTATDERKKDAQALFEEAAFAAMVETMKRKDEASHRAFFG